MTLRREPTYLSTEVWKACWLLARARSTEADEQTGGNMKTADGMADEILRNAIREKYPQLLEHQKAIDKLERELLKTL